VTPGRVVFVGPTEEGWETDEGPQKRGGGPGQIPEKNSQGCVGVVGGEGNPNKQRGLDKTQTKQCTVSKKEKRRSWIGEEINHQRTAEGRENVLGWNPTEKEFWDGKKWKGYRDAYHC